MAIEQLTIEQAQAIVARYEATEREVEREFQDRIVAAFAAMRNNTGPRGPHSAPAQAYRALTIEQVETFKARVADIYAHYSTAYGIVREYESAVARGRFADTMDFVDRIAYDHGDE